MGYVHHCPRCQSDYRPEVASCAECGGPLEGREESPDPRFQAPTGPPPPAAEPPLEGPVHTLYFSRELSSVRPLAERLVGAGIPCRVAAVPEPGCSGRPTLRYELVVQEADRARARTLIDEGAGIPAEFHGGPDRDFDPEVGYARCPACRATLAPGAVACRDCGLQLGVAAAGGCATCGGGAPSTGCPDCGEPAGDA